MIPLPPRYFLLARTGAFSDPPNKAFTGFIIERDTPGITPGRKVRGGEIGSIRGWRVGGKVRVGEMGGEEGVGMGRERYVVGLEAFLNKLHEMEIETSRLTWRE